MYHVSKLGSYGPTRHADMDGYVPDETDGPWDLNYDHGSQRTHDDDGELTEYGEWWESERFPEIKEAAIAATSESQEGITEWQGLEN